MLPAPPPPGPPRPPTFFTVLEGRAATAAPAGPPSPYGTSPPPAAAAYNTSERRPRWQWAGSASRRHRPTTPAPPSRLRRSCAHSAVCSSWQLRAAPILRAGRPAPETSRSAARNGPPPPPGRRRRLPLCATSSAAACSVGTVGRSGDVLRLIPSPASAAATFLSVPFGGSQQSQKGFHSSRPASPPFRPPPPTSFANIPRAVATGGPSNPCAQTDDARHLPPDPTVAVPTHLFALLGGCGQAHHRAQVGCRQ